MQEMLKKRREVEKAAEQQRKIEMVMAMQAEILALYEQPVEPVVLEDELAAVKASFERGLRNDWGDSA